MNRIIHDQEGRAMNTATYIETLQARIRQLECNVEALSEENEKLTKGVEAPVKKETR